MEKSTLKTQWLIVGGGPAGATAAKYLAKDGKDVLLLQRDLNFKKPCGGGLRKDAFSTFNISEQLIEFEIGQIDLHSKKRHHKVDISDRPLSIVNRVKFDRALRLNAVEAGAELIEGRFHDLKHSANGFVATATVEGKRVEIEAEHIVAADGVNSHLRRLITGKTPPAYLTNYADIPTPGDGGVHFYFGKEIAGNLYAWDFPEGNGRDIGTLAGSGNFELFCKYLGEKVPPRSKGYKIPKYESPLFEKDGVYFIGDAAGLVLPFTYEGIYYAMASGKMLAESVIESNEVGAFEKAWKNEYANKFDALKRLEKFFLGSNRRIEIMMRLFEHESVRRAMLELWMGDRRVPSGFELWRSVARHLLNKR